MIRPLTTSLETSTTLFNKTLSHITPIPQHQEENEVDLLPRGGYSRMYREGRLALSMQESAIKGEAT
jgi:hypothetical protein